MTVLPLALTACQGEVRPEAGPAASAPPAPTAPAIAPSISADSPEPSRSRAKLVGPRTNCGEVKAVNGEIFAVGVLSGRTTCATVLTVFRSYFAPGTPRQGSAGVATVNGWRCASNSAAQASASGRLSTCRKASTTITADVIP
ncbi:hypothetical protein [Actinomadura sp. 6K520]|uniref:hypothetical protein n=1 Tax=Actinomadura sp. 6K520 TaxID=2530364 RepID=UPI00104B14E1|nr:hypothetical protein [Actinomadura sp. 6K520]TDE20414.1 hypothetical protein E1289_32245 [Actinomadura sp. 6K520]